VPSANKPIAVAKDYGMLVLKMLEADAMIGGQQRIEAKPGHTVLPSGTNPDRQQRIGTRHILRNRRCAVHHPNRVSDQGEGAE
jgi:hypothetical protein